MKTVVAVIVAFLMLLASCQHKSQNTSLDKSTDKSDSIETYHSIVSDDSLVTAIWHDTGEGGTAPDIDCVVNFESEDGEQHEEHRPLLRLAQPDDDNSHHEVQKIDRIDDACRHRSFVYCMTANV